MSKSILTITDYEITRFGYFKRFAKKNPDLFGNLEATLKELIKWIQGKSLLDTKTYEGASLDTFPTYLMGVVTNKNEYLVSIWNENHSEDGNVLAVPLNSIVGSAVISSTVIPDGSVPGYPTYFWFRPSKNQYSTVQFPGALNGRSNLELYVTNFLAKFHPVHVVSADHDDSDAEFDKQIIGYTKGESKTDKVIDHKDVITEFKSILLKDPNQEAEILRLQDRIYGLVRKEEITGNATTETSFLGMMVNKLGINTIDSHTASMTYRVKYEVNFEPSESELKQILDSWENDDEAKWDNVGFKVSGRSSPVWIDSSISRAKHEIEVKYNEHNAVNMMALLMELQNLPTSN